LRDLETLRNFLSGKSLLTLFDAPWAPLVLSLIYFFHPVLGTIALLGSLTLIGLAIVNEMLSRRMYSDISALTMETNNFGEASVRNSEAVKAMGMLGNLRRYWQRKRQRLLAVQTKSSEQFAIIMGIARYVRLSLQILIMGVGAYFVINDQFTPGMMFAAAMLVGRGITPLEQAVVQWRSLGMARLAYGRLQKMLEMNLLQQEGLELPPPRGELTIQQLVVAPPGMQEPVLKGVNVHLEAGEALGIFGPTGSGKSTLARVLVGVWPPRSGTVRLDDADVFIWNSEQLGPYIGYLPQDVELFDGTVAENIARFSNAASGDIIAAAQEAGAHEMILRLPQGYDSHIGEGGGNLAGGQRQRLGLARALFGQPTLIVLDEPNSNLDAEGEQALFKAMMNIKRRGATLVVIAHRPNILGRLDKIMLLRNGMVEAFGPPGEVLQKHSPRPLAPGARRPQGGMS
jgi:PrtD family type I secretion system ABC transporter